MDMKFLLGMGVGLAAGTAAGMAMQPKKKHSAASSALRTAESLLEAMTR